MNFRHLGLGLSPHDRGSIIQKVLQWVIFKVFGPIRSEVCNFRIVRRSVRKPLGRSDICSSNMHTRVLLAHHT